MQETDYDRIKVELNEGHLKNLYLLCGNEVFLKNALLKKMMKFADKTAGYSLERVKFEKGFSASELDQALNTVSFFGKGKFIVCNNTEIFKGKNKREDFEKVLGNIPEDCYVVFIEASTDKKNTLFVEISKAGFSYSIDMRKLGDLSRYITNKFKKNKKKISYENINIFIEYSGSSLNDIESDIEKILLYMGDETEVKKEYIANLCSGTREYKIYEMTNFIFRRDTGRSLKLLQDLLADKTPVQVILSTIHNSLRELTQVKEAIEKGRDPVVYRKGRPLADFIIRNLSRQAANYTLGGLRKFIIKAAQADMDIKLGKINDVSAIEILVNELSTV